MNLSCVNNLNRKIMITILNNNRFLKDTLGVKFNFCALIGKITPIFILKDNTTNIFIGFKYNYQHYWYK